MEDKIRFYTKMSHPKISLKSYQEIKWLREGGKILAQILKILEAETQKAVERKISTADLDFLTRKIINSFGVEPAFLGYQGFPAALCVSVNSEVVHGVPSPKRFIKNGDLVKLDLGIKYQNLITDSAITVPVGQVSKVAKKLIFATQKALEIGIKKIKPGAFLGDYGHAIESWAKKKGFSAVRGLVGHGVGYKVHEPPQIPNFGKSGTGVKLKPRMVLALEPMLNQGKSEVVNAPHDPLVFISKDGKLSAHFEHTVVVTEKGCEVLTKLD